MASHRPAAWRGKRGDDLRSNYLQGIPKETRLNGWRCVAAGGTSHHRREAASKRPQESEKTREKTQETYLRTQRPGRAS